MALKTNAIYLLKGYSRDTLKNKISPSTLSEEQKEELQKMIEEGLIKFFLAPNGTRKEWIISRDAMVVWFGEPRISKE
ncbi:DNA-binding protein [Bacillus mycoides]|uniref:DNA-binding protein n=1 Tax=Bacillus mycoides TaxID=1405 RepID=UPI003CFBC4E5